MEVERQRGLSSMRWQHDLNAQGWFDLYGDVTKRRPAIHAHPEYRGTQDFSRLPTDLLSGASRDDEQAQGQPDTCPAA